jgi:hypothetical protein
MMIKSLIRKIYNKFVDTNTIFLVSIIWISIIFSTWDLRQYLLLGEYFDKLLISDYWILSNHVSWIALSNEVSQGNFFPAYSFHDYTVSEFRFFPYLSLWFSGFLIYIFGVTDSVLVGSTLLPVLSYIFMTLIFKNFLSWRWSISLSSLGVLGFSSASFRDFLSGLIMGRGWLDLGVNNFPDIVNFPFPAISLLSFLFVFYLSIKKIHMSKMRMILLSVLWGIQSQVHIVNAIIGIPFWIGLLILVNFRSNRNHWEAKQTRQLLVHFFIILLICLPALFSIWAQSTNNEGLSLLVDTSTNLKSVNWFMIIVYFAVPLAALAFTYRVFRVDPYEILYKFLPIWIVMSVELILVLLWGFFGIGIPSELLFNRITLFFLHIFYFVPPIYYMNRFKFNYHFGTESLLISKKIRSMLHWFFRDASLVYLPLFFLLLTAFSISSSEKSFQHFKEYVVPAHKEVSKIIHLLSEGVESDEVLIGPDNITNISLMYRGEYKTLWTNKIISVDDRGSVIERFSLYAKIIGWTEDDFLLFMKPSDLTYSTKRIALNSSRVVPGLGYWLTFNNKIMKDVEIDKLILKLKDIYKKINVNKMLKEYNVKKIVVNKNSVFAKRHKGKVIGEYKIIKLN